MAAILTREGSTSLERKLWPVLERRQTSGVSRVIPLDPRWSGSGYNFENVHSVVGGKKSFKNIA